MSKFWVKIHSKFWVNVNNEAISKKENHLINQLYQAIYRRPLRKWAATLKQRETQDDNMGI